MDPNSQHQLWSRWTATVTPSTTTVPPYEVVKVNCARFFAKAFGSESEMRITTTDTQWTIICRTEGHPVHDPTYVSYMTGHLYKFLQHGFGQQARVKFDVKLEAGDRQDGTPADQLIIGPPPIVLDTRLLRDAPPDQTIGGPVPVVLVNKLQEK